MLATAKIAGGCAIAGPLGRDGSNDTTDNDQREQGSSVLHAPSTGGTAHSNPSSPSLSASCVDSRTGPIRCSSALAGPAVATATRRAAVEAAPSSHRVRTPNYRARRAQAPPPQGWPAVVAPGVLGRGAGPATGWVGNRSDPSKLTDKYGDHSGHLESLLVSRGLLGPDGPVEASCADLHLSIDICVNLISPHRSR